MVYLNNAATSYPKPPSVIEAMMAALSSPPVSSLRSTLRSEDLLTALRQQLGRLFNISDWQRIFFCSSATDAINRIVSGLKWNSSDYFADSHNSVLRPLFNNFVTTDSGDYRFMFLNHCNNVTGEIHDISVEGADRCVCPSGNANLLMVDAAQSAGCIPIDVDGWGIDILVFTGHKALFGPMGTGGYYVSRKLHLRPSQFGGTGRDSSIIRYDDGDDWEYEVGTQNMPGLAGLKAGVEYVLERGVENIFRKEQQLTQWLIDELQSIPKLHLYTANSNHVGKGFSDCPSNNFHKRNTKKQGPVVSFNIEGLAPSDVGYILQNSYDITVRTGLHCAPLVHRHLGTEKQGTVRVSLSDFTTRQDLQALVDAVNEIAKSL